MLNLRSTGQEIHSKELKDFDSEENGKISANEELYCVKKSEQHYQQQLKLNQIDFTVNNIFTEKQQINREAQKAVEFKAQALFELERVIIELEFKQSYK